MTIRPRFQRAFMQWLTAARPRFILQPRLWRRSDHRLVLRFDQVNPAASTELSRFTQSGGATAYRLEVWGRTDGAPDALFHAGVDIRRRDVGHDTRGHPQPWSPVGTDRRTIWTNALFEPFLEGSNTKLAQATSLARGHRLMPIDPGAQDLTLWVPSDKLVAAGEEIDCATFRLESIASLRTSAATQLWRRRRAD